MEKMKRSQVGGLPLQRDSSNEMDARKGLTKKGLAVIDAEMKRRQRCRQMPSMLSQPFNSFMRTEIYIPISRPFQVFLFNLRIPFLRPVQIRNGKYGARWLRNAKRLFTMVQKEECYVP